MATPQAQSQPMLRPYKYFYTPFLHGKFVRVVAASSILCYIEGALLGGWSDVWNWTPFSGTAIRTILLLITTLALLIVRVSTLHSGKRTTATRFGSAFAALLDAKTYETLFWYICSSWFFCEVYIWSRSIDVNLRLIDTGRSYEPDRFNERAVFLRTSMLVVGVVQAAIHLSLDLSRIDVGLPAANANASTQDSQQADAPPSAAELINKFKTYMTPIMLDAAFRATATALATPFFYFFFLRHAAWKFSLNFYSYFTEIPKKSKLSVVPIGIVDLVMRLFFMSFLLFTLWGVTNAVFTTLLSAEPLKKGKPLTDRSKDPNGSLIAGVKAQKVTVKTAALRELCLIVDQFPQRRQSIFKDVERKEGSIFSQILLVCLGELHILTKRIQDTRAPKATTASTAQLSEEEIKRLPHIAPPLKKDHIFKSLPPPASASETLEDAFGKFARSRGSHPGQKDPISPRARRLLAKGAESLLSKDQQQQLSPAALEQAAEGYFKQVLDSPIGLPFRVRLARQIDSITVGELVSPYGYSRAHIVVYGIASLTKLISWSIKEDQLGIVATNIPTVFRTFTSTAKTIEAFLDGQLSQNKSVEGNEPARKSDTASILMALQQSIEIIVNEFGEYRTELGIRADEWKDAKEIAARKPLLLSAPPTSTSSTAGVVNGTVQQRPEMQQVR